MKIFVLSAIMLMMLGGCRKSKTDGISARMAYEGVSNYCHSEFDWGPAQELNDTKQRSDKSGKRKKDLLSLKPQ